ncbi:xanthine dehydrogenase family protein subunit M [Nocardiopsis sp. FIRDI 009]|uniref:FAD binding domain-containing protein n=1 Tax=Nocardiopsis sp. FIRDI 009 TaxID=714197 RepID=UPI000E23153F|nr:FAD binding domain-containing protein [Nocardiopsis sp. FIRDI 009]
MTTTRPTDLGSALTELAGTGARPRAGGTDLTACVAHGVLAPAPVVDLTGIETLRGIDWRDDGSARVGALTSVHEVSADPRLGAAYPALARTAGALATPQIRRTATVGGNLLQRNRCWYLRNPAFDCFQTGGGSCPAREGDHLHGVVVDQGPCVAPHPSTVALALVAYDAVVEVSGDGGAVAERPVAGLYDGTDPSRDHVLDPSEVVTAVSLPAPAPGELAAYLRATGRSRSEWPLVEVTARLVRAEGGAGPVASAAVAVGGVARTPLRLPEVESSLVGAVPGAEPGAGFAAALDGLAARCSPLPATGYKVALLRETVRAGVERALGFARA